MRRVCCWLICALSASSLHAANFLVGPPMSPYTSIQSAINAALAAGGTNEIRIRSGTYAGNLSIPSSMISGNLLITGGWNALWTFRNTNPALTIIDSNSLSRGLDIEIAGGWVQVEGLTITEGRAPDEDFGGGVLVWTTGSSIVSFVNVVIRDSDAVNDAWADGGGLFADLRNDAILSIVDSTITGNEAISADEDAYGGGLSVHLRDDAHVSISGSSIEGNAARAGASGWAVGGGLNLVCWDDSSAELTGNRFVDNRLASGMECLATGASLGLGPGPDPSLASVVARRNVFLANLEDPQTMACRTVQLYGRTSRGSTLRVSDSVVAAGTFGGASIRAETDAKLYVTNLTVADHPSVGLLINGYGSEATLFNSIVFNNGSNASLNGTVLNGNNLIGVVDPLFTDPAGRDYSVRAGSPAIDSGLDTPPDGLGPLDVEGNPRIFNGQVDIGAYECLLLFADGFESGTTQAWVSVP